MSRIRADIITNKAGTGSPKFTNGTVIGTGASIHSPTTNVLTLGTNDVERVRIDSNGRVGIGTDNPSNPLHISTSSITPLLVESTGADSYIRFQNSGGSSGYVGYLNAQEMVFWVNGSERLRVDSSGRIGIGTDSPNSLVDLYNEGPSITFKDSDDDSRSRIRYNRNPSGSSAAFIFECDLDDSNSAADVQSISFRVGGSSAADEVVGITSTNLKIANGNLVFSTSGKGIDFSATADGSGTTSSEILNDYEEGSWTPGLSFGEGTAGITYGTQDGHYVRVGRMVYCMGIITLSNNGTSTGDAKITGLPYQVSDLLTATSLEGGGLITYTTNIDGSIEPPYSIAPVNNTTAAGLYASPQNNELGANMQDSNFSNTASIRFSFTYIANT